MASISQSNAIPTPGTASTTPGNGAMPGAEETLSRVVQGAHAAVDRMAEKAGPAVERLRSGLSGAAERLQSGAEDLGELQERWMETARSYVREHPLASVGVALAAGVVLSRLLNPPRR